MKVKNIPRQLLFLLGLSVGVTLLASAAFYVTLQRSVGQSSTLTRTTVAEMDNSYELLARLSAIQSAVQGVLRQKDPDEIENGINQVETAQKEALKLIAACGEDGKPIREPFERLGVQRKAVVDQLLLGNAGQAYEQFLSAYNPQYEAVLKAAAAYQQRVQKHAQEQMIVHHKRIQKNVIWQCSGIGAVLLVLIVIGWRIRRSITRLLQDVAGGLTVAGETLFASASQISSASQSLAEGASEQAASLEETSASLEQMASMTKRNSENAQKANDLAKHARSAADKGAGDMQSMSAAMEAIKVSSDDIAKIIKTIDEIAFQTNILALNAAVEAARAGEAGMGFAVVADEVRNLAQRSAQAAKETASKIEGAITKTGQGVEISTKVAQTLNDIVARVRQVDELVAEVSGASREQTQGITQINMAVGQMDKVTQSNAANAEQTASAASELNAQAASLKQIVHDLQTLVGTKTADTAPESDPSATSPQKARGTQRLPSAGTPRERPFADTSKPAASGSGTHKPDEIPLEARAAVGDTKLPLPHDSDFRDF